MPYNTEANALLKLKYSAVETQNEQMYAELKVTAILVIIMFTLCSIGCTYLCCKSCSKINQKAATVTSIDKKVERRSRNIQKKLEET